MLIRSIEVNVKPRLNEKWRLAASARKAAIESQGGRVNYYGVLGDAPGNRVLYTAFFESPESFAEFSDKMSESNAVAEAMAPFRDDEDFPFSEPVAQRMYRDLHDEVGEPQGMPENATVIVSYRFSPLPGERDRAVAFVKANRDIRKAEGLPVGALMQCMFGDTGLWLATRGFEDMSAWAAAQGEAPSKELAKLAEETMAKGPIFASAPLVRLARVIDL